MDLNEKIALVTGGAGGLGLAYVTELLRNGVKHVTIADVQVEQGQTAVQTLTEQFGKNRVMFVKCDVTNSDDLENAFKTTISTFKGLDILINNAGIANENNWELTVAINLGAVVRGTMLALKYMGKDKGGKGGVVVNIASVLGLQPWGAVPVYVATKHAVIGYSRSLGTPDHYERTGIRVLTMCPGFTYTMIVKPCPNNYPEPAFAVMARDQIKQFPFQQVEPVAKNMMTLIKKGTNGSVWVSESDEAYEIEIPDRRTIRKK